jgi:membrane protein YqaA with SNARE-associated domain
MTIAHLARDRAVIFLTGATCGALLGLALGSWIGDALLAGVLDAWRWVREEVLHREDQLDFELLLQ